MWALRPLLANLPPRGWRVLALRFFGNLTQTCRVCRRPPLPDFARARSLSGSRQAAAPGSNPEKRCR